MNEDHRLPARLPTLAAALRNAAAAPVPGLDDRAAPAALHAALRAAAKERSGAADKAGAPHRSATARPWPTVRGLGWPAWGAATSAALLAGVSVLLMLSPPPKAAGAGVQVASLSEFMPLAPLERWPQQAELAWVVQTELPRERLAALGLPFDPARAGERVPAQLLVTQRGDWLAVRLAP